MALKVGADDLLLDPTSSGTRRRRPPRAVRRSTHLLRSDKLVHEVVLVDDAPFVPLIVEKRKKQTEYGAKAVRLSQQRYIVCVNHRRCRRDAAERHSVLERQLKKGDKALVPPLSRHPRRWAFRHRPRQGRRFDGLFIAAHQHRSQPAPGDAPLQCRARGAHRSSQARGERPAPRRPARDPRRSRLAYREPDRTGWKALPRSRPPRPAASLAPCAAGVALPPAVRPAATADPAGPEM
jgi:hypothetical protein